MNSKNCSYRCSIFYMSIARLWTPNTSVGTELPSSPTFWVNHHKHLLSNIGYGIRVLRAER